MSAGLRLEDFEIVREIGKGGFGVVYEAVHPQFNRVALKKINCGSGGVPLHRIKSEYELLNNVSHNNIIKFYGQFKTKNDVYLVLELCPHGSMRSYVRKNGPLSETAAAYVLKQLLCAVQQLHAKRIMHRDLSAGNILISKMSSDGLLPTIKICDFGLARSMRTGGPPRTIVGTPGFMAPELLGGDSYDEAADVFSLGAAMYTMLTAEDPPVKGKPPLNNICHLAADLINSMMAEESERITVREIFLSQFMKTYLPDGRGTLNSFYGSREHSVDRARTSYERRGINRKSGQEDRRFGPTDQERFSRGRRDASYDRRGSDRMSAGYEREGGRRRAASQPPTREHVITKERREESGFQSGGDQILHNAQKKPAHISQSLLPTAIGRKDQPWPLRTERLNGKIFIRPRIGRLRVTDTGDLFFEQESAKGTVAKIMSIYFNTNRRQEITTYLPVLSTKPFPKQDDPRVELMRTSRCGPFSTLVFFYCTWLYRDCFFSFTIPVSSS
ncbi:unnamed protein product [Auanema sp. JU1783]|nr:unnamed protein product [Auanema sp. JU1783]